MTQEGRGPGLRADGLRQSGETDSQQSPIGMNEFGIARPTQSFQCCNCKRPCCYQPVELLCIGLPACLVLPHSSRCPQTPSRSDFRCSEGEWPRHESKRLVSATLGGCKLPL